MPFSCPGYQSKGGDRTKRRRKSRLSLASKGDHVLPSTPPPRALAFSSLVSNSKSPVLQQASEAAARQQQMMTCGCLSGWLCFGARKAALGAAACRLPRSLLWFAPSPAPPRLLSVQTFSHRVYHAGGIAR